MAGQTQEKLEQGRQQVTDKAGGMMSQLPVGRLRSEAQGLGQAIGRQGMARVGQRVEGLTQRLSDYAEGKPSAKAAKAVAKGDSPVKAGAKAAVGKVQNTVGRVQGTVGRVQDTVGKTVSGLRRGNEEGKKLKVTNIVESIDVPVSREIAYEQWTQFEDFPTFTKKVENVKQEADEVVTWQAQVFWSHRTWKATILDQVPNERIVWKSESEKGRVDGAVTFHELAPDLTRILVTLEYHPKGLFEHTGNLWRAQGRRVRLEMKHFRRHVANHTLLHEDEVEGWKGEIHDEQVTDEGRGEQQTEEPSPATEGVKGRASDESAESGERGDRSESEDEGRAARRPAGSKPGATKPRKKSAKRPATSERRSSGTPSASRS